MAALSKLRDPVTNEPVFEAVLRGAEMDSVHLRHPENAGDVWVNARPGFWLRSGIGEGMPVFEQQPAGGMHGYLSSNRKIQAIFYAFGPRVPSGPLEVVRQVDVAPTAAALLGIDPPKDAQGRPVLKPTE